MAAQMIGLQAGYSFASTVDPTTQADTTTLQLMAQLFAGSLFFAFGFDRQVIRILAKSFESIPSGTYAVERPGGGGHHAAGFGNLFDRAAAGASGAGAAALAGHCICGARPAADATATAFAFLRGEDAGRPGVSQQRRLDSSRPFSTKAGAVTFATLARLLAH